MAKYNVALATQGTRGDLQPLLALGAGLKRGGHRVLVLGNRDHCQSALEFGFEVADCVPEVKDLLQTEQGKKAMEDGDLVAAFRGYDRGVGGEQFTKALQDFKPDLLIFTLLIEPHVATYLRDHLDLPTLQLMYQPQCIPSNEHGPTEMYRIELEEGQPLMSKWQIRMAHEVQSAQKFIQDVRALGYAEEEIELKLRTPEEAYQLLFEIEKLPSPMLMAYSEAFWPYPSDWPTHNIKVLGRLCFDKADQDQRAQSGSRLFDAGAEQGKCMDFIKAGKPPVYIGWGSMTPKSDSHMTILAVDALRIADQRGIIVAGWADVSTESLSSAENSAELQKFCAENVLFLKSAPHEWLFPQCSCCVHHGGIGTIQASLGAAAPTVVTPVFADQHDVANLITGRKLGLGTSRLPILSSRELGEAIKKVCADPEMKENCAKLASRMAREDGVATAIGVIDSFMADVTSGAWKRRKDEFKAKCVVEKKKITDKMSGEQLAAAYGTKLAKRHPELQAWSEKKMEKYAQCNDLARANKLYYVKGSTCLVRAGEKLKSDEVGRYKEFAFLELLEQKGSRLHVRKVKGSGPAEGWVSAEVKGVEIVTKIPSAMLIGKVMAEEQKKIWADIFSSIANY